MKEFLTPVIVSAIITSIIAPLAFYVLKRYDEKRKQNFDVRYAEYKHYLKTLDEITSAVRMDSEKYFSETVSETFRVIISNPEQSNDALLRLHDSLGEMQSNIQKTFTKAEGELHGLKLVCSDKLLTMVNDYVALQRDLMNATTKMMGNWKSIDINNPSSFITGELNEKAQQAQVLYNKILLQMRNELKIS